MFKTASKKEAKLRLALFGPAGSGKTYTALRIATHLGGRIAVMDTEHGSASKYADEFAFDVVEPDSFSPQVYIDTIRAAEQAGYAVLLIDSLSHAWMGKDGALEMVDKAAKRAGGNSFAGWKDVTPLHNRLIDTMLGAKLHIIVTMRSKTEYVITEDDRGKKVPRKIGLAPVQRDGMEYEFDIVGDLDVDNTLLISKSRCSALSGAAVQKPGKEVADAVLAWLAGEKPAAPDMEHNAAVDFIRAAGPLVGEDVEIDTGGRNVNFRAYVRREWNTIKTNKPIAMRVAAAVEEHSGGSLIQFAATGALPSAASLGNGDAGQTRQSPPTDLPPSVPSTESPAADGADAEYQSPWDED